MKKVDSIWFSPAPECAGLGMLAAILMKDHIPLPLTIGIVFVEYEENEPDPEKAGTRSAFIGFGMGRDQAEDEKRIMEWGARLTPAHVAIMAKNFRGKIIVNPEEKKEG